MKKLFFIIVAITLPSIAKAQSYLEGDMNHDGYINVTDITILVNKILNLGPQINKKCPDENHPHMIDLGLPSGTLWSCCNVDAVNPEEYGGYYAWGEIEEKDVYNWSTYIYCNGTLNSCYDIGNNICGTYKDVAYVKWGEKWCMPTMDQYYELLNNCSYEWVTSLENSIQGIKFTSNINAGTLFFPAAGTKRESILEGCDNTICYFSSTLSETYNFYAIGTNFHKNNQYLGQINRADGLPVRPVTR